MWECLKYNVNKLEWEELGELDLPQECFGDDLYDHMVETGWVDSMNNYDVDGDSEFVAVMGKTKLDGEFRWE